MENKKISQQINNVVDDNIEKLKTIFPNVVKDGVVDFKALELELRQITEEETEQKERYDFTWAGKTKAKKMAQEDIYCKTLNYIEGDGKDEDTTQNLYIEGDNLEVLKLLRQNYYGAIKMIYIDPPYNTGSDFIYNDNFRCDSIESDIKEGIRNEEGARLEKNTKSSNKYHAKWLNMMYPRLKIAKDLLTEDGVIFISIDDNEAHNLRKICDEVFGDSSYVTTIAVELSTTMGMKVGSAKKGNIVKNGENILIYSKDKRKNICKNIIYDLREFDTHFSIYYNKNTNEYCKLKDKLKENNILQNEMLKFNESNLSKLYEKSLIIKEYIISNASYIFQDGNFDVNISEDEKNSICEFPKHIVRDDKEYIVIKNNNKNIRQLMSLESLIGYANDYYKTYGLRKIRGDFWKDYYLDMVNINKEGDVNFSNGKKPTRLIKDLIYLLNLEDNSIILDFFSGSATTAHAVMQLNAEDGGKRKYIMVQIQEDLDKNLKIATDTKLKKALKQSISFLDTIKKPHFITEIGKERIRRAGAKILEENKDKDGIQNLDVGFKVFRVANTNIKWNNIQNMEQLDVNTLKDTPDQLDFILNAKDKDIVYEIMLRQKNIPLTSKLVLLDNIGSRTYLYANLYLICLETNITDEIIEKLSQINPLPRKFIFRDSAFGEDCARKEKTFRLLDNLIKKNYGEDTYNVEFI